MSKTLLVELSAEDRKALEKIVRGGTHKARVVKRAQVLLRSDRAKGKPHTQAEVSENLGVCMSMVSATCRRYAQHGLDAALSEKPRPGQAPKITGEIEAKLITLACSTPPAGHAKWALRLLASEVVRLEYLDSISHTAIRNTLKKTRLSPGK